MPGTYAAQYCQANGIPYEAYSTSLEEFTFEYPNDREATLTAWSGTADYVVVPAMADDTHAVTQIGQSVFKGNRSLQRVSLPDSAREIGLFAFDTCRSLTRITLPWDLETLGEYAFRNCVNLAEVVFNDGPLTVKDGAFENCPLLTGE